MMVLSIWKTYSIALLALLPALSSAHIVMTYPGWRGDNLQSNGTQEQFADSGGVGVGPNNTFPYGMQWMYPCGGMPLSTNRSLWPIGGGAVAAQPGWFSGHATAFVYINLGIGTLPVNMSLNMVPVFQIVGPSKNSYPGDGFCLPQVPLPQGYYPNVGDNATIQVVEAAIHGAALYSCVDITFANPEDVPPVNSSNCVNSSDISFTTVFTTTNLNAGGRAIPSPTVLTTALPALLATWLLFASLS